MNLKESYRYANYVDGLMVQACTYINTIDFMTSTKQEHQKSKANNEAEDTVIELQKPYDVPFTPNDVIDFMTELMDEKAALLDAIAAAKHNTEIDIDNAVSMNKKKHWFINALKNLELLKPQEKQEQEYDYKFNVDGNQTKYYYPVKSTVTIDYDRNCVKKLLRKYNRECDEVSAKLDSIEINTEVDFQPKFDVNDSFEDAIMGTQ